MNIVHPVIRPQIDTDRRALFVAVKADVQPRATERSAPPHPSANAMRDREAEDPERWDGMS